MSHSLSAALEVGGIHYRLAAYDPSSAASAMIAALPMLSPQDRKEVLETLLAQGEHMLTLLHEGVAIPHVKRPAALPASAPLLALFFLEKPLELMTDDGKRVETLFFLLSPTIKEHLEMLSHIAAALKHEGFKTALARKDKPEDILREIRRFEGSAQ